MHKIINAIKVSTLALVLSFGLSYVYAWTAPTVNPPAGNVSAPINTSITTQTKSGDFTLRTLMPDTIAIGLPINANAITAPKFCLGASCISAWPAVGGGGTVTSLSAGTGTTLSPNPIITTGTISVDTAVVQSRVSGTCAVGQAITAIATNGTVTCGGGSGTLTSLSAGTGITLSPSPITTTGTITNSGVTSISGGACTAGQVVTRIDSTGAATCAALSASLTKPWVCVCDDSRGGVTTSSANLSANLSTSICFTASTGTKFAYHCAMVQ